MPFTIVPMSRFALFAPRHWPTWLLVAPLVVLAHLPWRLQFACGRLIGRVAQHVAHRRRAITATNLAHCFPELDQAERERLLHEHFEALGIGLTETALCWWAPDWRLHRRVEIYGIEHLQRATEAGHGVLMLTAHFTTLELGGRLLAMAHPVMPVYRPHENPVIEHLMQTRRRARTVGVIRRGDLRSMLHHLRRNTTIWYAGPSLSWPAGCDGTLFRHSRSDQYRHLAYRSRYGCPRSPLFRQAPEQWALPAGYSACTGQFPVR